MLPTETARFTLTLLIILLSTAREQVEQERTNHEGRVTASDIIHWKLRKIFAVSQEATPSDAPSVGTDRRGARPFEVSDFLLLGSQDRGIWSQNWRPDNKRIFFSFSFLFSPDLYSRISDRRSQVMRNVFRRVSSLGWGRRASFLHCVCTTEYSGYDSPLLGILRGGLDQHTHTHRAIRVNVG